MDQKKRILQAYHEGNLSQKDQKQLEKWIANGAIELDELAAFSETMDFLEVAEQIQSTPNLDRRFHETLEKQKAIKSQSLDFSFWFSKPWRLAIPALAGILLFWGGQQFGTTKSNALQISDTPSIAASLLNSEDVSEKIHLVSSTKIEDEIDKKIIDALLFTLSNDESNNVRLACIDVLMNYSYLPIVRAGLVSSISHQNSPVVLANLAEAIAASGQKMEKEEIHSRINKNLPPPLQKSMEDVLIKL